MKYFISYIRHDRPRFFVFQGTVEWKRTELNKKTFFLKIIESFAGSGKGKKFFAKKISY